MSRGFFFLGFLLFFFSPHDSSKSWWTLHVWRWERHSIAQSIAVAVSSIRQWKVCPAVHKLRLQSVRFRFWHSTSVYLTAHNNLVQTWDADGYTVQQANTIKKVPGSAALSVCVCCVCRVDENSTMVHELHSHELCIGHLAELLTELGVWQKLIDRRKLSTTQRVPSHGGGGVGEFHQSVADSWRNTFDGINFIRSNSKIRWCVCESCCHKTS